MTRNSIISTLITVSLLGAIFLFFYSFNITENTCPLFKTSNKAKVSMGSHSFNADVARTLREKAKGLGGRETIGEDEGMLFLYNKPQTRGFWMKGMKFPIDIIWIKRGTVIGFEKNLPSQTNPPFKIYYPLEPVDAVLEVKSGTVDRIGLKKGENLTLSLLCA